MYEFNFDDGMKQGVKRMARVSMVTNMLPPYRVSLYNEIGKGVEFTVILDTISEFNRNWDISPEVTFFKTIVQNCRSFVYKRLRNDVGYTEKRQFQFSERTLFKLCETSPDVVVTIEYGFKTFWSLFYGWFYDVPVILASEGTIHTEGHVGWFKRCIRKLIVSQCSRFWSNGPDSTRLLVSYGADPTFIDEGMTGIDTDEWQHELNACLADRERIRKELGLRGKVLLFSGSLSPRKGVVLLAEAVEQWHKEKTVGDFTLLLLGDGECREWLQDWAKRNPAIHLVMPGFLQRHDLPPYFAAADWAVLPTIDDNWPLVTLETLVAGLPQLFSIYNGATRDLGTPSSGVVFDPLNQGDFVQALERLSELHNSRVSGDVIEHFSRYYCAQSQAERACRSFSAALAGSDLHNS